MLVSQSNPLLQASSFHSSLYPLPSKRIGLDSLIYSRMTLTMAFSFSCPEAIFSSTDNLNCFNWKATAELRAIIAEAQLAEEPTARNSKRFPVNANGDVRLRSVLSINNSGIWEIFSLTPILSPNEIIASSELFSKSSRTLDIWEPKKIDMIAGGASLAPKRWALVAEDILAFNNPLCLYTAIITFTKKVTNCKFPWGVFAGAIKGTPIFVPNDQLLCFPEPFTPLKGFSCNKTRKPWRRATLLINSIITWLWSFAKLHSS